MIWRGDLRAKRASGTFEDVGKIIRGIASPYENAAVFDGFDFVPRGERFSRDYSVCPNDGKVPCRFAFDICMFVGESGVYIVLPSVLLVSGVAIAFSSA